MPRKATSRKVRVAKTSQRKSTSKRSILYDFFDEATLELFRSRTRLTHPLDPRVSPKCWSMKALTTVGQYHRWKFYHDEEHIARFDERNIECDLCHLPFALCEKSVYDLFKWIRHRDICQNRTPCERQEEYEKPEAVKRRENKIWVRGPVNLNASPLAHSSRKAKEPLLVKSIPNRVLPPRVCKNWPQDNDGEASTQPRLLVPRTCSASPTPATPELSTDDSDDDVEMQDANSLPATPPSQLSCCTLPLDDAVDDATSVIEDVSPHPETFGTREAHRSSPPRPSPSPIPDPFSHGLQYLHMLAGVCCEAPKAPKAPKAVNPS